MRKNIFRTLIAAVMLCVLFTVSAYAEEAVVTASDVNFRSGPGMNYRVIDCLPKGAQVTVNDRSNSSWYAVTYNGTSGFMSSSYLRISEDESSGSSVVSDEGTGYINAMYVRFRSGPSSDYSILGEYNKGKALTVTGTSGSWTACIIDGQPGYVYSDYVSASYQAPAPAGEDEYYEEEEESYEESTAPSGPVYSDSSSSVLIGSNDSPVYTPEPVPAATPKPSAPAAPETPTPTEAPASPAPAVTSSDSKSGYINGDYVRFRTGPSTSYSIINSYNKGKALTITGVSGDWTQCTIDGKSGYVYTQYVKENTTAQAETPAQNTTPAAPETPAVTATEEKSGYITGNSVRFRSGPSMSSDILGEFNYGNAVTITGKSGDWTAVTYNGKQGFVFSQYVKEGSYSYVSTPSTGSSGGSDLGRRIADFALQYVGYNYCWGGASPSTGFDCSGLVYYTYGQFGYTLNRVAEDQANNGVHVDPSDLQPGDILCFYSGGSYIGHAGIYIGNNQFVHAANSATGVIVSELSGSYASRGYEARRIV